MNFFLEVPCQLTYNFVKKLGNEIKRSVRIHTKSPLVYDGYFIIHKASKPFSKKKYLMHPMLAAKYANNFGLIGSKLYTELVVVTQKNTYI